MNLSVCDLTRRFGSKTAVNHVSFDVKPGIVGLLGPNGAGKTTLIRMLCDLLRPNEGSVLLDGQDIHQMGAEYRSILGYVPQKIGFYPWFTGEKYLRYLATLKGLDKAQAADRIGLLLEKVGLTAEAGKRLGAYSGGMLQRIGIAQALLNDPKVLILDEPTAGLDPQERIRFRTLIAGLAQDRLVLLSTHIVSDVEHIATQVLILKDGQLLAQDSIDRICQPFSGQVCTLTVLPEQAALYQTRYAVTNMQPAEGLIRLRMVCPGGIPKGGIPITPGLEDAYLALCRGEEAE